MSKFDVDLCVGVLGYAYATVTVEAENEDEARELAKEESLSVSDLHDVSVSEITEPWYVEYVEKVDAA